MVNEGVGCPCRAADAEVQALVSSLARRLVDHAGQLAAEEDAERDDAGHGLEDHDLSAGREALD